MKRLLVAALLVFVPAAVAAAPLTGVQADPATIGCVFDPNCVITDIVDTTDKLDLPGASTGGLMHTRMFMGKPGSQAEGLHIYLYRIDLTNARGGQTTPMVQTFTLDFGKPVPLDYNGDGMKEDYFTVDFAGTAGGIVPDYADRMQYRTSFHFYDGVPLSRSSMFIGMAASGAPVSKTARVTEGLSALLVDPGIFTAFLDPCLYRRPDLNDDFTPAQRDVLDDLVLGYVDACVIGLHYTPGIHSNANLLPWHRTYIDGLENYLSAQGHSEFVPFPKWLSSNPIPAEFQDIDPDCTSADTAVCAQNADPDGPGDCAALADTTPNIAKPASLVYPALCDYADRSALTSGIDGGWHGGVHCAIGGAMCSYHSPSANIFWGHHGNVDDVWLEWECRCKSIINFPVDYLPFDLLTPCRVVPCWVAWYRFEDPYIFDPMRVMPQEFGDLRGAKNPAIPVGDPATIAGEVGTALSFDGKDDYLRVPDHPELNPGMEDMGIDLWVKTMAAGRQPLVEKMDDAGVGFSFFLQDGMPAFEMKSMAAGAQRVAAVWTGSVTDGKWHHLAVSVKRNSPIGGRLFVDGMAVAAFDPRPASGKIINSSEMWIGRDRAMAGVRQGAFLVGALDEMDIFKRALKPDEVAGIFEAGPAGKPGALPLQTPVAFREICNGRAIGEPGTRVTVPITLDDGDGVAGFQVDLNFDPGVLTPVMVTLGADTAAAGGWAVVMAPIGPGMLRILGESNPPAGLGPGPREVARVEFDIAAAAPVGQSLLSETDCALGDKDGVGILCRPCANPGVVIVRNASAFRFRPLPSIVGVDRFDPLPFQATVEAIDSLGNVATGYGRTAMMSLALGICPVDSLVPPTLPFVSGLGGPDTFRIFCCTNPIASFPVPLALTASDPPLEITGTSETLAGIAKGDLDANGGSDVLDVLRDVRLSLAQSVAQPPSTAFQMWAGDMLDEHCLADRMNNVLDVLRVRNKSLGRPPLCPCGGPFAGEMATVLPNAPTPMGVRLEKAGPRTWLVVVTGAADLGGVQFEIKGASPDTAVTPDGLASGQGWQAFTDPGHANVMRVVAFASATGGITGDGVVLKITGAGSPKIRTVVASDQNGRAVPVQ